MKAFHKLLGIFFWKILVFWKNYFRFEQLSHYESGCGGILLIIGRFQIVKTFIIFIFLHRTSLIPIGEDFMWNRRIKLSLILSWRERIKLSALSTLVSEIEDGGLKTPYLESIIVRQKVLCSGGSRPWAKGEGGGGVLIFFLPCWPFSLQSLLLFLPKIRGGGALP